MLQRNEFSVEASMQIIMRHQKPHDKNLPLKLANTTDNIVVTETLLKECTLKMAKLVQEDDTYLPIFTRLKTELENLRCQNELKEYARQLANDEVVL